MSAVLQAAPVVYAGVRGAPVRIAPFDPHGVQPVTLDIQDWLGADSYVNAIFTPNDSRVLMGNGVRTKLVGTGSVKVPLAPTPFLDPTTQRQRIRAYYFLDDQADPAEIINLDFVITVSLEATIHADDRSLLTELVEK